MLVQLDYQPASLTRAVADQCSQSAKIGRLAVQDQASVREVVGVHANGYARTNACTPLVAGLTWLWEHLCVGISELIMLSHRSFSSLDLTYARTHLRASVGAQSPEGVNHEGVTPWRLLNSHPRLI